MGGVYLLACVVELKVLEQPACSPIELARNDTAIPAPDIRHRRTRRLRGHRPCGQHRTGVGEGQPVFM